MVKKLLTTIAPLLLTTLLVVSLSLQPFAHTGSLKKAEAQFALESTQWQNVFVNSISSQMNTFTSQAVGTLQIKEFALDAVLFWVAKLALQSMTQSLLTWINGGFQGSPAFIQDLEAFALDTADRTFGQIISESSLAGLCEPFALDVQIAVTNSFINRQSTAEDYETQCRLSDVSDNIQGFFDGDFIGGGGWPAWLEVTQRPNENTALGQKLALEAAVNAKIAGAQINETKLLEFGDGFLSMKQCDNPNDPNDCVVVTPGQAISEALTFQLSVGPRTLIEADEIQELIGALFQQLLNRALQGVGGLFGLTESSYFDDLRDYNNDPNNRPNIDDWVIDPIVIVVPDAPDDPNDPGDPVDPVDPPIDPVIGDPDMPPADPVV